jgi:hypothetical protein
MWQIYAYLGVESVEASKTTPDSNIRILMNPLLISN